MRVWSSDTLYLNLPDLGDVIWLVTYYVFKGTTTTATRLIIARWRFETIARDAYSRRRLHRAKRRVCKSTEERDEEIEEAEEAKRAFHRCAARKKFKRITSSAELARSTVGGFIPKASWESTIWRKKTEEKLRSRNENETFASLRSRVCFVTRNREVALSMYRYKRLRSTQRREFASLLQNKCGISPSHSHTHTHIHKGRSHRVSSSARLYRIMRSQAGGQEEQATFHLTIHPPGYRFDRRNRPSRAISLSWRRRGFVFAYLLPSFLPTYLYPLLSASISPPRRPRRQNTFLVSLNFARPTIQGATRRTSRATRHIRGRRALMTPRAHGMNNTATTGLPSRRELLNFPA